MNFNVIHSAMIKRAADAAKKTTKPATKSTKKKEDPNRRDASFSAEHDEKTNTVKNPNIKVDAPDKHDSREFFIRGTNQLPKGQRPTPLAALNTGGWGDYRPGELPWRQQVLDYLESRSDRATRDAVDEMDRNIAGGYGWPKANIKDTTQRTLADYNKGPMNDYRPGELDWRSRTIGQLTGPGKGGLMEAEKASLGDLWSNWPTSKPNTQAPYKAFSPATLKAMKRLRKMKSVR